METKAGGSTVPFQVWTDHKTLNTYKLLRNWTCARLGGHYSFRGSIFTLPTDLVRKMLNLMLSPATLRILLEKSHQRPSYDPKYLSTPSKWTSRGRSRKQWGPRQLPADAWTGDSSYSVGSCLPTLWPSRYQQNLAIYPTHVLEARDEGGCVELCCCLHGLCTSQSHTSVTTGSTTTTPHTSPSLVTHSTRFCHWLTPIQPQHHHTDYCWQILQGSTLYSTHKTPASLRNRPIPNNTCHQTSQNPHRHCIR